MWLLCVLRDFLNEVIDGCLCQNVSYFIVRLRQGSQRSRLNKTKLREEDKKENEVWSSWKEIWCWNVIINVNGFCSPSSAPFKNLISDFKIKLKREEQNADKKKLNHQIFRINETKKKTTKISVGTLWPLSRRDTKCVVRYLANIIHISYHWLCFQNKPKVNYFFMIISHSFLVLSPSSIIIVRFCCILKCYF